MHVPEIPNFITILTQSPLKDTSFVHFLHYFENPIFSFLIVIAVSVIVIMGTRKLSMIPGKFQNFIELIVEKLRSFFGGVLGEKYGDRFLPYIGSLFLFIFFSNLLGLVPFFKSPTSSFRSTVALGILTFLYVQYTGIKENGIRRYILHLAGSPCDMVGWVMSPLMFILHIIGELAKPVSLSLRLFGNILGEDILLGSFVGMGIAVLAVIGFHLPFGIPLQLPFLFLALLTSFIQALVFALLSTIYFLLILPHEQH